MHNSFLLDFISASLMPNVMQKTMSIVNPERTESKRTLNLCGLTQTLLLPPNQIHKCWQQNKNYYVVRNAGCARSRYTLKLSLIFF